MLHATSERIFTPLTAAVALAVALGAATIVMLLGPGLWLDIRAPNLRSALEAAGVVAAGLTAGIAYVHLVLSGERVWLYLSVAFLVIGLNRLVFGVIVPPRRIDVQTASYLWTAARLEMGVLLLMGAVAGRRARSDPAPRARYGMVALAAVAVLAAMQALTWFARDALPALNTDTRLIGTANGVDRGLTIVDVALGSSGAVLLLLTAFLFARGGSLERRIRTWIACVLVLAAFSHIHYMLVPTIFSDRISTGDFLRLLMLVALLLALFDDIRLTYVRERGRARELEAAYRAEQARVQELEEVDRAKAQLLQMLSHELLHPVAAIRALATGLSKGEATLDDEAKRRAVGAILGQSEQLRDLVERAPRVDELKLDVEPIFTEQRVDELVEHVRHTFPHLADRLTIDVEPDAAGATVRSDIGRMMQVFHNLFSNAEKFSPPGSPVAVTARCRDDEIVFEVRDAGGGIPRGDVERSFDPFVRLPNANGTSGSGIGLHIVRSIVEAHGGHVWIDGGEQPGTAVLFALPREAAGSA
jgi:signal transduction histidine kinase